MNLLNQSSNFNILTEENFIRHAPFGNTLIIGAGPVAIQVAVNVSQGWSDYIGLVNRKSAHTLRLKKELQQNNFFVTSQVQDEKYRYLSGKVKLNHFYEGFEDMDDIWKTIFICTPSDSYKDIINTLELDSLKTVRTIILISPSIASNHLVNSQLKKSKDRIDVISFSTYYAATKLKHKDSSVLTSFTKALKKRIYIASSKNDSIAVLDVKNFIEKLGTQCVIFNNTIEAESRNITTYVHPPLFINEFSLDEIFNSKESNKWMYKIYPEGPITQHSIRSMVLLWKEITEVIKYFGAKPINLLKFLNDDNYPVHERTLSREDIDNFTEFQQTKQEYLLYIRYSSILIDPFSTPDDRGKYFDFSAVPYKQVYKDENEKWVIPRVPIEDYKRLKLVYSLALKANISTPHIYQLILLFEKRLGRFINEMGESSFCKEILYDTTEDDVDKIFNEMEIEK